MSQYEPLYDSFSHGGHGGYVPTPRMSVSASVYLPGSDVTAQLKAARDAVSSAQSAEEMYDANLLLSGTAEAAYIALDQAGLSDTDKRLLTGAMDELRSSQLQLEREAENYNDEIDNAIDVYRKLPTRFLHQEPRGFE